eukprot:scaffold7337_cov106-Skeletonema_marinoi.AAC.10
MTAINFIRLDSNDANAIKLNEANAHSVSDCFKKLEATSVNTFTTEQSTRTNNFSEVSRNF